MRNHVHSLARTALCAVAALAIVGPVRAQQLTNAAYQTNVNVMVEPVAELIISGSNLLYLQVPPPSSTIPSAGVNFTVNGNASATLVAEPDDFIEITTGPDAGWMGKAIIGAQAVGYKLELRFPRTGVVGSPVQIAALPGFEAGPTDPPLTVDLQATGGSRTGVVHMEASHEWTADGSLPLPGIYVGQVVLTLTADF